jgi:hypothetical protein
MILSEIPAPQKERDTQMYSAVHNEPENKPALRVIPTPKDRFMIAVVSLIMLLFLAAITINVIMALSSSKLK